MDGIDESERPLPDVRVVTGSGRDTLTDENGYFLIGDLPPGEHILLLDEKTLPERTRSAAGSVTVKITGGNETATVVARHPTPGPDQKIPKRVASLRLSAYLCVLCVKKWLYAEHAEVRREPQRLFVSQRHERIYFSRAAGGDGSGEKADEG